MSAFLWCKKITLVLFFGVSCNSNDDCKTIPKCEMVCMTSGPNYYCNSRVLIEVPSFPESTLLLDLSDNAIILNSDTFADNVNVYFMDLSINHLLSVPDDVFRNNVALETLDISTNSLFSVPAHAFKNNMKLIHLDLSNNNLFSLPDDVFKNNVALTTLYLYWNYLTTLPLNLFSSNADLQDLNLDDNKLTSLPDDVFRYNVALTHLSIVRNSLTTLPLNVFSSNVELENLDLSKNNLTSLPDGVFENNVALTIIDCSECFDCDCLSASTYRWIIKIVKEPNRYRFTCRKGLSLPNTDFNCSDDGSRLAVKNIQNDSWCFCKEFLSMKSSSVMSMDLTIDTTLALESTIDKVEHKTKNNDSSYTYIAVIISGMVASITIITALTALRSFMNKTSRISHLDQADIQDDIINDSMNLAITINCNEQINKEYNNIAPTSHMILS